MSAEIIIRDIDGMRELKAIEDLQKEIWGVEDREILPALALVPMQHLGAVLIGAFDGEELVGFVFGFPGLENRELIIHSDMLAVKANYRLHNLGFRLKLAQRERALEQGISKITWTFDPLQAANAYFNFAKLGVIATAYKVDFYGKTSSPLHRTGTDRLWVTWLLECDMVKAKVHGEWTPAALPPDTQVLLRSAPNLEPILSEFPARSRELLIEIPPDINAIVSQDLSLALRWREATRQAFIQAFSAGHIVTEFQRERNAYRVSFEF